MVKSEDTHMLQPMHSRMSSMRPSSILRGRKGSAIEGRAAPMKSITPRLICDTIASGEVNLPTPTTGLLVNFFTKAMNDSCDPSGPKRDGMESRCQPRMLTSQRSGTSASISTALRDSSMSASPVAPSS